MRPRSSGKRPLHEARRKRARDASSATRVPGEAGYRSAVERLREVAPVFSGRELVLLTGWSSARASQYLYRWRERGLVRPLGGKSDVYFNLLREGDWRDRIPEALARLYPAGVLIGPRPLHEAGWITQPVEIYDVAVPPDVPRYRIEAIARVHERPHAWFRALPAMTAPSGTLRRLPPAWALADMRLTCHPGLPDDDEIYWALVGKRAERDIERATKALQSVRAAPAVPSKERRGSVR